MKKYQKKTSGRYDVSELVEAQFEPGSRRRVLKNLLGIKRKREMDRLEGLEQLRALSELIKIYSCERGGRGTLLKKLNFS
jgi:hypothetical protein